MTRSEARGGQPRASAGARALLSRQASHSRPAGMTSDQMEQLRQFGELHAQELLTDDEFARGEGEAAGECLSDGCSSRRVGSGPAGPQPAPLRHRRPVAQRPVWATTRPDATASRRAW